MTTEELAGVPLPSLKLKVLRHPDERLRRKAEQVRLDQMDDGLRQLVSDMTEAMSEEGGIGLAAPQVNVPLRVIIWTAPSWCS
jgi:peptide deformylase